MKILVTFAVDAEFAPWRKLREFRRIADAPRAIFEAAHGEDTLRVVVTGMGWENASRAMIGALDPLPDVCISSGLCGGLHADQRTGEILAARRVGEIGEASVARCDESLLAAAAECGARVVDKFVTATGVVASPEAKRRLAQFGDAVEMESLPILSAAVREGVASIAIRAISDAADEYIPYDCGLLMDPRGQVRLGRLISQVARRPHRLPALVRLGRESRRAATALAQFLEIYVSSVIEQKSACEMDCLVEAT